MSSVSLASMIPLPSDDATTSRAEKRARPATKSAPDMSFSDSLALEEIQRKMAAMKIEMEMLKKEAKKIGNNRKALVRARWLYYQEHKEDAFILATLREKLRSVGLGPKIPYQLVKKETDKQFAALEQQDIDIYISLAKTAM